MKYLVLVVICFASIQISAQNVLISGSILNFHNQLQVEDLSEIGALNLPDLDRSFIPDSSGKFSVSFNLTKPNYFSIGRNILYLSPGDTLQVNLDFNAPAKAIFSGNKKTTVAANSFLETTPFPKDGSFLDGGVNIKKSIQATIDTVLIIAKQRQNILDSCKGITEEFYQLEKVRIHADVVNSLWILPSYFYWKYPVSKDSMPDFIDWIQKITDPYISQYLNDFINPAYLKLEVYREMIYYNQKVISKKNQNIQINDFVMSMGIFRKLVSLENKNDIKALKLSIDSIQTNEYHTSLVKTFDNKMGLTIGDQAKDLLVTNKNGKSVLLSSFKGKTIYIDIWAIWCSPCLAELPYLDSLKKTFANNNQIEFISLSIEDDMQKWKNYVAKNNLSCTQMIIDRTLLKDYNVITIPRAIIIDKEFKIAAMFGGLPSKTKTAEFLKKLCKGLPVK